MTVSKLVDNRAEEREKWDRMIAELDDMCRNRPKAYMARLIGLVALGYAYIGFVLGTLCIVTVLLVLLLIKLPILALKLGIPLLIVIAVIGRSFWIKSQPPPQGIYLKKRDYPELFAAVEEIRKAIDAPPVHEIVVVNDCNAAVSQRARLGLLGWHKNYLLLGMPLMQAFSLDGVKAVLAHEMGHLAKSHGARAAWIYRVRGVWEQLMDNLQQDGSFATLMFRKFFNWYAPYFDASSFALARVQEFHADQCSIDLVGKEAAAAMLIATHVRGEYVGQVYWQDMWSKGIKQSKTPPTTPYTNISTAVRENIDMEKAMVWLDEALNLKTNYHDTHPCLKDRLADILNLSPDYAAQWAKRNLADILAPEMCAAQALFGSKLPELLTCLDAEYCAEVAPTWEQQHQQFIFSRGELIQLQEKAVREPLNDEELVLQACRTAQVHSFADAQPLFAQALEKVPNNVDLHLSYGQWLMEEKNEVGIRHLEKAMELDPSLSFECCQYICSFLATKGRHKEVEKYGEIAGDSLRDLLHAQGERSGIMLDDTYLEHALTDAQVLAISHQLRQWDKLAKAYLVRKNVKYFPDKPLYVLIVDFKFGLGPSDETLVGQIAQSVQFPGEAFVIPKANAPAPLSKMISRTPAALIYG